MKAELLMLEFPAVILSNGGTLTAYDNEADALDDLDDLNLGVMWI